MERVALITDTTADLPQEIINKYNIQALPFRIIYKDREYRDKIEITSEEVYRGLKKEVPTSSMPSLQDMEDTYSKLEGEGYTHVIGITLSSGLSGIYNGLTLVSKNHPNIKSCICDSKSISLGEGALVEECAKLLEGGRSFEQVVKAIPSIQNRIHLFFVVDTLEYLIKGGRIGKVAGTIGTLLNLKPIISTDKEGNYYTYAKARGKKQALSKVIEIAEQLSKNKKCRALVVDGNGKEDAIKVKESIEKLSNITSVYYCGCISPVSGVHSGPGLVGLVCIEEE
ncbi:DegV family protein [Clostridium pasteurianum]|uniref:EDD domain protein, DegV family n=1 Tax=Clostridium pasteurianum BC1 TaxID=86416 RepID=R4K849_CLOPA|nr:DegV family protein [Clostridium pasteurianum]AGK98728.1 EDD domain protein, DegV family [Clostridium pasteurianum BC1]